ncbi:MAG: hypothetical protein JXQ90_10015 [Cyclobacteriaceae bacterium]
MAKFSRLPNIPYHNLFWIFLASVAFITVALRDYDEVSIEDEIVDDGVSKYYDDLGTLRLEVPMKEGSRHGVSKSYDELGQLKSEMTYVMGTREGVAKKYYKSGKLYASSFYQADKLNGKRNRYYSNGQMMSTITYFDGVPQSDLIEYTRSGKKRNLPVPKLKEDPLGSGYFITFDPPCYRQIFQLKATFDSELITLPRKNDDSFVLSNERIENIDTTQTQMFCECTTKMGNPHFVILNGDEIALK